MSRMLFTNSYIHPVQSYNAVNYDEKIMDGFYDVYGITSNSALQGKMPLLVDLQAISLSDNLDYEVILVNHLIDPKLQELEEKVCNVSVECQLHELGLVLSGLIQKVADIVVERMGGPVGDAEEIYGRWIARRTELRDSLNTNIFPLGCLDVGLSRHRALLFKVVNFLTYFIFLVKLIDEQYYLPFNLAWLS